jgi:hypothetical protein
MGMQTAWLLVQFGHISTWNYITNNDAAAF